MANHSELQSPTNIQAQYFTLILNSTKTQRLLQQRGNSVFIHLQKLTSINVSKPILFDLSFLYLMSLNVFVYMLVSRPLGEKQENLINITKTCSRIIGVPISNLNSLMSRKVLQKQRVQCVSHILKKRFVILPSGRRYLAPGRKTKSVFSILFLIDWSMSCVKYVCMYVCMIYSDLGYKVQYSESE